MNKRSKEMLKIQYVWLRNISSGVFGIQLLHLLSKKALGIVSNLLMLLFSGIIWFNLSLQRKKSSYQLMMWGNRIS